MENLKDVIVIWLVFIGRWMFRIGIILGIVLTLLNLSGIYHTSWSSVALVGLATPFCTALLFAVFVMMLGRDETDIKILTGK